MGHPWLRDSTHWQKRVVPAHADVPCQALSVEWNELPGTHRTAFVSASSRLRTKPSNSPVPALKFGNRNSLTAEPQWLQRMRELRVTEIGVQLTLSQV